ncbi:hypothetical protein SSAG_02917 [Streptomyces sp. Mg1]|nr:hypothetical protein SSAG_02917 [Streptomyces sp. Mg1]
MRNIIVVFIGVSGPRLARWGVGQRFADLVKGKAKHLNPSPNREVMAMTV